MTSLANPVRDFLPEIVRHGRFPMCDVGPIVSYVAGIFPGLGAFSANLRRPQARGTRALRPGDRRGSRPSLILSSAVAQSVDTRALFVLREQRGAEGAVYGVPGLADLGCVADDHDLLVGPGEPPQVFSGSPSSPVVEPVS